MSDNSHVDSGSEDEDSEVSSDLSDDTSESEEEVYATLPRFPVEAVFMEKMEYTLDSIGIRDNNQNHIYINPILIQNNYMKS